MNQVRRQSGFTLIEMIVSLALFSVVITIAVGALLTLINTNAQLQSEQNVLTNLSFTLDSMAREIRTGTNYFCRPMSVDNTPYIPSTGNAPNIYNPSLNIDGVGTRTYDCNFGRRLTATSARSRFHGITFIEGGNSITAGSSRILYYHDNTQGKIFRRVGSGAAQPITSSGIYIKDFDVFVSSSGSLSGGDPNQPSVTIFIEAGETQTSESFFIQTTIAQRTLDI